MAELMEHARREIGESAAERLDQRTSARVRWVQLVAVLIAGGLITTVVGQVWLVCARAAARHTCLENLKELGTAFHAYHTQHERFPAAAIVGSRGDPLLSWRVELLPYLGLQALYDEFHRDEPWNSPHNLKLLSKMPRVYACPEAPNRRRGMTSYRVIVGPKAGLGVVGTMFEQARGIDLREVTDGTSNTLMVAEGLGLAPWTKPEELGLPEGTAVPSFHAAHAAGFHILFADGSARFVSLTIAPATLRALLTRDGGEVVSA